MTQIQDSLPDNNVPEFLFTEREISHLEEKYRFDVLREELVNENKNYGEFERCYKDYLDRSLTILNDDIYPRGFSYLKDEIEAWTRQVSDSDAKLENHLLNEAPEATSNGINDSDFDRLCRQWVKYIIQEDP